MSKKIDQILLREGSTIKMAMECLDKTGFKIALVINKKKRLLGAVTDGDIRRALLLKKKMNSPIKTVMIVNPITAKEGTPAAELLGLMLAKEIQQIPIVNNNNTPVDIVQLSELKSIPLSSPDITHKEVEVINKVLSTPFLSIGPRVKEFENKIASYVGTKYAIAVNSGTSGLHLCVRSLGIKDGDEVITTPFSFIASANCLLFERAKPVFADIKEDTRCIAPERIEEKITKKTKAILPVHIFGQPCQMDKIMKIAKHRNLYVIEDACEAIGAKYKNKKVGTFGDAAVFSFYPNKQMTTAEGGVVVTNNEKIAKLCQSMRNQGRDEDGTWLSHKRLGYNYRMSELSAALGETQIGRIDEFLKKRQRVAGLYNKILSKVKGIKIPYVAPNAKMSWFVYVINLDDKIFSREDRDAIIQKLNERGIAARDYFPPIHLEPFYVDMFNYKKGDFPITERVSSSTIALPFYNNLREEEIDYICENLKSVIDKFL